MCECKCARRTTGIRDDDVGSSVSAIIRGADSRCFDGLARLVIDPTKGGRRSGHGCGFSRGLAKVARQASIQRRVLRSTHWVRHVAAVGNSSVATPTL